MTRPVIVFVINSIGYGGAERALANILDGGAHLAERYDVHLVTLDDEPDGRVMPAWPTRHRLNARGSLVRSAWQLARLLRRLRPQLCVSLLVRANLCSIMAGRVAAGCKVIMCERMHLSSHLEGRYSGWKLAVAKALPRLIYRRANVALGVSSGVSDDLVAHFGVPAERSSTIFNPYDLAGIRREGARTAAIELPASFIVAVGRLVAAKNFAMLIDAYLDADIPPDLLILGDGEERAALEGLIRARGAQNRIRLLGYLSDPFPVLSRAFFYASASRNEGFPNAMVEAMALGVPVIATDCPSGPAEILDRAEQVPVISVAAARYGLLTPVDDRQRLSEAMKRMCEPDTRAHYARMARQRAEDFDLQAIASLYWSLFGRVLAGGASPGDITRRNKAR